MDDDDAFKVLEDVIRDGTLMKKDVSIPLTIDDLISANKGNHQLLNDMINEIAKDDVIIDKVKEEIIGKIKDALNDNKDVFNDEENGENIFREIAIRKNSILRATRELNDLEAKIGKIRDVLLSGVREVPGSSLPDLQILRELEGTKLKLVQIKDFMFRMRDEIRVLQSTLSSTREGKSIDDFQPRIVDPSRDKEENMKGYMPCVDCPSRVTCDFVDEEINYGRSRKTCLGNTWQVFDLES